MTASLKQQGAILVCLYGRPGDSQVYRQLAGFEVKPQPRHDGLVVDPLPKGK